MGFSLSACFFHVFRYSLSLTGIDRGAPCNLKHNDSSLNRTEHRHVDPLSLISLTYWWYTTSISQVATCCFQDNTYITFTFMFFFTCWLFILSLGIARQIKVCSFKQWTKHTNNESKKTYSSPLSSRRQKVCIKFPWSTLSPLFVFTLL